MRSHPTFAPRPQIGTIYLPVSWQWLDYAELNSMLGEFEGECLLISACSKISANKKHLFATFWKQIGDLISHPQIYTTPILIRTKSAKDSPIREKNHPIFVALERGLDMSVEANIQPTVIESQI